MPQPDTPVPTVATMDGNYREAAYLRAFPDVAAAVAAGDFTSGLAHYRQTGRDEMLDGTRTMPAMFRAELTIDDSDGTHCCIDFGAAEHEFDCTLYLALFPDVEAGVGRTRSAVFGHWLEFGFAEITSGRRRIPFSLPPAYVEPRRRAVNGGDAERHMGLGGADRVEMAQFRTRDFTRLLTRPFGVTLFGPLAMVSGLGTVARGILAGLDAAGIPVDPWPYDTSRNFRPMVRAEPPLRYRINLLLVNADVIGNLFSALPAGTLDDAYNIVVWQWELAAMPSDVVLALGDVDEIWTSSTFERDAIAAVVPVPVHVMPPPVVVRAFTGRPPALPGIDADSFVFVTILDMASRLERKNTAAAIEAFARLDRPGTALVVKLHGSDQYPAQAALLRQQAARCAGVLLIDRMMSDTEMTGLRARADCLLSPHRSEGFGLNIAEFMALGKPVIATNYSGSAEFLDETVGYPVEYDLVEIGTAIPPYPAGYSWADPRPLSLLARMREVLDDPAGRATRVAAAASRMADRFNPTRTGAMMAARLEELGLHASLPPFMRSPAGVDRLLDRHAAPGIVHPGPAFSIPVPVADPEAGDRAVAALQAQRNGCWEALLRPDPGTVPAEWSGAQAGTPRLRLLHGAHTGFVEAATCPFLLFVADPAALDPDLLAAVGAALAAEPMLDAVFRAPDVVAVRKSMLLAMNEPGLTPAGALTPEFARRLTARTRLLRRLLPLPGLAD